MIPTLRRLCTLGLASALCTAAAHATLVFGEITLTPDPPTPQAATTWRVTLEDVSLAGVEDAIVFLDLRPLPTDGGDGEGTTILIERLAEVAPAVYEVTTPAPAAGTYLLLIRDQTFTWEEATASVVLTIGADANGVLPFILPPTRVAPRSLTTWLLWLIGIPLAAGGLVTVLVLRGSQPPAQGRSA